MDKEKVIAIAREMVEKRTSEAFERMDDMPMCKTVYEEMCKAGYVEQMKVFKNLVFYNAILHPEWGDEDILMDIYKNFMKITY